MNYEYRGRKLSFEFLGHGFRVFFAEDATLACSLARLHRPDFVLLDIYMPNTDGWQTLAQLRQVAPQAAILMVTGSSHMADFNASLEQRVDGFCIKPVMSGVMQKALLNARRRRKATHQ